MNWSNLKDMADALKSICLLILYIGIAIFFFFFLWPIIEAKFQKHEMDLQTIDAGFFKFTAVEKQALKTIDSASNQISKTSVDTNKISLNVFNAAKIIDTLIQENSIWVYLGQIKNNKLTNTHFRIVSIPRSGDIITAADGVYKRGSLPAQLKNGNWILGTIKGVVQANESVKIITVKEIEDQNYWAQIDK